MVLSLKTFGAFAIHDEFGTELFLRTRKTRSLLAYLAFHANKPQPRERLMALLWGERDERQARQSLNDALASIRRMGRVNGSVLLDSDSEQVTLHAGAIESDIARFRSLRDEDPAAVTDLYDGPFLEGMLVPAPAFEEWLATTRSEFEADFCNVLGLAADRAAERGDTDQALNLAARLVALDPLREDAHRRLMRHLYDSGDRTGALRQYQVCKEILNRELQVDPDAKTTALFEKIRAGIEINATLSTPTPDDTRLPDKPSIAVLAFDNMSCDPEQSFFGYAMAEDITTRLAQRHDMLVVARKSSFTYEDRSVTTQQIGRELGVRCLLEGSVQKAGEDIRITAQLIEAATGRHIWAERYDRKLQNLFAVQDEIARDVAIELAVNLTEGEMARYHSEGTDNAEAFKYFRRGRAAFVRVRKEAMTQAVRMFEKAIELDPQYARAIAWLGFVRYMENFLGWADDPERAMQQAEQLARRAIAIDENTAYGYVVLSKVHLFRGEYDEAIAAGKHAIEIEPGNAALYSALAQTSITAGLLEEASELVEEMLRLAPRPPVLVLASELWVHYMSGRYEETIGACQKLLAQSDNTESSASAFRKMIASYMALDREPDARAVARIHMEKFPGFSLRRHAKVLEIRCYKDPSWIDVHIDRLRRAGLPD